MAVGAVIVKELIVFVAAHESVVVCAASGVVCARTAIEKVNVRFA